MKHSTIKHGKLNERGNRLVPAMPNWKFGHILTLIWAMSYGLTRYGRAAVQPITNVLSEYDDQDVRCVLDFLEDEWMFCSNHYQVLDDPEKLFKAIIAEYMASSTDR